MECNEGGVIESASSDMREPPAAVPVPVWGERILFKYYHYNFIIASIKTMERNMLT